MRLFIAINFEEDVLDAIEGVISGLGDCADAGRFTPRENLHLTLHFLGEQPYDRVAAIRRAMDRAACPAFSLELGGLGVFRREGGDVYWLGVTTPPGLKHLHSNLGRALEEEGFAPEQRPYRPHITLSRQTRMKPGFDPRAFEKTIPPMALQVRRFSLMLSERQNGRMVYTELTGKDLLI